MVDFVGVPVLSGEICTSGLGSWEEQSWVDTSTNEDIFTEIDGRTPHFMIHGTSTALISPKPLS
jgi:hypothetical protein